jgi:drug/metabolite transporter (DMT)-like permease
VPHAPSQSLFRLLRRPGSPAGGLIVPLLMAGFSALLYGIADFSGGFAAGRSRLLPVLVLSQVMGTVVALLAVAVMGRAHPAWQDLAWGATAGLTGSLGLAMLYGGIARSIVAIVSPVSAVVGAMLPVLFAFALGERPSALALAGCCLCLPAIVLLTWERGSAGRMEGSIRTALTYGLLAGLGFGLFFVSISRARPSAGFWPMVAARAASLSVFAGALLARRERFSVAWRALPAALLAGSADMVANLLFMLASQTGMLSLAAVITSLYPAPTVLLARFVLGQRLPAVRIAGLALAITGVALISLR